MKPYITIRSASGNCDVHIGNGILTKIAAAERLQRASAVGIVYDENTRRLFSRTIARAGAPLAGAPAIAFPPGEKHKNLSTVETIVEFFAAKRLDRTSAIVSVGGGVVTDAGGFAASMFMRGIPWVAVPTTLLGMVDAAIGGKTGVDLKSGKNLAGAFHPPASVWMDLATLTSLPRRQRAGGLAEMIKIALACDPGLFVKLERAGADLLNCAPTALEPMIRQAVLAKARLVEADERDHGARLALNLGHTTGHALEAATEYEEFHHGEAVAIGLRVAMELAAARGLLHEATKKRVEELLTKCDLPLSLPKRVSNKAILARILNDKKAKSQQIRFILPVDRFLTKAAFVEPAEIARALDAAR